MHYLVFKECKEIMVNLELGYVAYLALTLLSRWLFDVLDKSIVSVFTVTTSSCKLIYSTDQKQQPTRGVLSEKMFLKISQNSQENTCARVSFLIKLQTSGLRSANLLKKRH